MIDIIGLHLDRALELAQSELGLRPEVERAVPPRGVPEREGVWRVVRADLSRGRITAAFFPLPETGDDPGAEK